MKNNLALIFSENEWADEDFIRVHTNVHRRFNADYDFSIFSAITPSRKLPFDTDGSINRLEKLNDFDVLVYATNNENTTDLNRLKVTKYIVNKKGVVKKISRRLDSSDYPFIDSHIFNRLSSGRAEEFIYTPFGVHAVFPNMGGIDEFGNRIPFDYRSKIERQPNEKIIVILGGSAGFGLDCHYEDTFGFILQNSLNQYCREKNKEIFFSVINFSQIGLVVLEQTNRYITFCNLLEPEIVISHDGWNDLSLGLVSDPFLMNNHEICYRINFEQWAQKLHETGHICCTQDPKNFKTKNLPIKVINAYINRKLMLKKIVESNKGEFIWGFQPALFSKANPSNEEMRSLSDRDCRNFQSMACIFDTKLPHVFEEARKIMKSSLNFEIADLHQWFKQFGEKENLFYDRVHTSPEGEKKIAEYYHQYILKNLIKNY
jgi:hypothetical protein